MSWEPSGGPTDKFPLRRVLFVFAEKDLLTYAYTTGVVYIRMACAILV